MLLTPEAAALGLTLSTFATGFPNSLGAGPLGMAFLPSGAVLVSDYPGNIRIFPDGRDGQDAASVPVAQNHGYANAVDITQVGGNIYMTQQAGDSLVQLNPDGSFNQVILSGLPFAAGLAPNRTNGHIFVSSYGNATVWDVDPVAKTKTAFVHAATDGLTLSPDGATLYGASGGHILGWSTSTGAQVFDSGLLPGTPDGVALGAGYFAGQIFTNTNGGQLYSIDQRTLAHTLVATGGSRGDFVTVDPTNRTLLITQTDRILRLTGVTFATEAPEPESLLLIAFGLGCIAVRRRYAVR